MARKFKKQDGRSTKLPPTDRVCQKCGRGESIHAHHIKARSDGGDDAPDNLMDLCSACHAEWHAIEQCTMIRFGDWLQAPPYMVLYASWLNHPQKATINMVTAMWRELRQMGTTSPGPAL